MNILRQPYPYFYQGKTYWRIAGLILVIGFLFEYFIIPFERNPDEHLYSYAVISLFHVGTAILVYLVFFALLGRFIRDEDWQLYKELITVFFLLTFIGMSQWAIRPLIYDSPYNLTWGAFREEVWHTWLSGSIVFFLVITANLRFFTQKNEQASARMHLPSGDPAPGKPVNIVTQVQADNFRLDPSSLICARAEGNYLELFLWENESLEKQLKRMTLQALDKQLSDWPGLLKTHRAWLVNTSYIEKISGNAQGYQLAMRHLDLEVPVSRKHLYSFNKVMG